MGILTKLGTGQGYLKAGLMGFASSGKTYTATEIALGTRSLFNLKGPIAFFDTEGGSEYVAEKIVKRTGMDVVGTRSHAFDDLLATARECEQTGVSVLIVDSISHVWTELQKSHLAAVNANRKHPRRNMEFQDWGPVKERWGEWTTFFLNSKLHIIFCGRAGFTYDHETNEETGRKQLVKTGTKMKAENEFGYEPSLLIEMEQVKLPKGKLVNRATVLKDRFDVICGRQFDSPSFEQFQPHIARLVAGAHAPIDTSLKSTVLVDDDGNYERRRRNIYAEEIQNELVVAYPGQTAEHKKAKLTIIRDVFGTTSWTAVEGMSAERLRDGRDKIRSILKPDEVSAPEVEEPALEIPFAREVRPQ